MRSIILGPPGLIMLAALLGAIGALWAAIQQSGLRNKNEGNASKQLDLLRDISARGGNQKELEELVRTRSRALNANRQQADNIADGIIKRLPELTAEFKAIEQSKLDVYQQRDTDFRLKWQPLVESTLQAFDSLVEQCRKRGVDLQMSKKDFPLTAEGRPGAFPKHYKVREVKFGKVMLVVEYTPVMLVDGGYTPGGMSVRCGELPNVPITNPSLLHLDLNPEHGVCGWALPDLPGESSGVVAAPKDGIPPKEFSQFIEQAFARAFERFLIMADAASVKAAATRESP